jgi:DNA-binding winged helix-turn-helix (wHTH) protein
MDVLTSHPFRQIELGSETTFELGGVHFNPGAHEVSWAGSTEQLQPQIFKVLVALSGRRGEVVSRDEIIDRCWSGRIVGADVINRAILMLRGLGRRNGAFAIETVPKAGYRLVERTPTATPVTRAAWMVTIAGVGALAAVGITAAGIWRSSGGRDQSHPPVAVIQLAPFVAVGGEKAASDLARVSDVVVADMLSNGGLPVVNSASAPGVRKFGDFRLSGQVRANGKQIEESLQLDDLVHGTILLSKRFRAPLSQARDLPEQVGAFAATALGNAGAMMALDRQRPADPRLTGEVLRQWTLMINTEDPIQAYRTVDRISDQMPDSPVAQLGLALISSHVLQFLPPEDQERALAKARVAAGRARALAPTDGDVAWTDCHLHSPARLKECEISLSKAFRLDPDGLFVAAGMRNHLVAVGRFAEALPYDRLAVAAMPYMAGRLAGSTMLLESLGQHVPADEQFQRARRWWPHNELTFSLRLQGMLDGGDVENAAAFAGTIPSDMQVIDKAAVAAIAASVKAKRLGQVRSRCSSPALDDNLTYLCLVALIKLDDIDGAMTIADRLYPNLLANDPQEEDRLYLARREGFGLGVLSTPALAPLREDPRFVRIVERVGLMRYWRQVHPPDFCTLRHEPVCRIIARQ